MTKKNTIQVGIYLKQHGNKASGTWEAEHPPCMDTLSDIIVESIDDRYTFDRSQIRITAKSGGRSGSWEVPAVPVKNIPVAAKGAHEA